MKVLRYSITVVMVVFIGVSSAIANADRASVVDTIGDTEIKYYNHFCQPYFLPADQYYLDSTKSHWVEPFVERLINGYAAPEYYDTYYEECWYVEEMRSPVNYVRASDNTDNDSKDTDDDKSWFDESTLIARIVNEEGCFLLKDYQVAEIKKMWDESGLEMYEKQKRINFVIFPDDYAYVSVSCGGTAGVGNIYKIIDDNGKKRLSFLELMWIS